MDLENSIEEIISKDDFANFLNALNRDLMLNPDDWENTTLERFLEAMEAWLRSMESYSRNLKDQEVMTPSWKTFAKIILASKIYE